MVVDVYRHKKTPEATNPRGQSSQESNQTRKMAPFVKPIWGWLVDFLPTYTIYNFQFKGITNGM